MKSIAIILIVVAPGLFGFSLTAQDVLVKEDPTLERALKLFVQRNASEDYKIEGWRILLIATRDRRKIDDASAKFRRYYRGLESKMIFIDPYYKLLYGAFRTKLEAMTALERMKEHYPGAFEVRDRVTYEELYTNLMESAE